MLEIDAKLDIEFEEAAEQAEEEKAKRFEITDLGKAEWATKKIAQRQAAIEEIKAMAEERIEAYKTWCEEQIAPLQKDINFFEALLRPYAEAEIAKKGKGKSHKLPNGCNLKFTKASPDYDYDKDELLKWLKDSKYNDYIKIEEKAKWGDFKNACEIVILPEEDDNGNVIDVPKLVVSETGEYVDVVKVIPAGEDKFSVDVKGFKNDKN